MEDRNKKLADLVEILEIVIKEHEALIRLLEDKEVISRAELLQEMKKIDN